MIMAAALPAAAQTPDATRATLRTVVRVALADGSPQHVERVRAYQGRNSGPEQTERFSRKVRLARDGRVTVANISGDITVTTGSGDEVAIDAVKRARGDAGQLASVQIDVQERGGSVFVQTNHRGGNDHVSVDYTITVPAAAALDVHSVSGNVKVTGARGSVRVESVSGNVAANDTPKLETAKSVSGDVSVSGVSTDGDLAASSVSGGVTAKSIKVRTLELSSVSGDLRATDVSCERLTAKSVSGEIEYGGTIARGGTYDINAHSGDVRLTLADPPGFVLNASSFSGTIRSDLPLTLGGDASTTGNRGRNRESHSMRATFGDGSATLTIRTFSGDIVISKR
jgi:DUF4097 and DUF4098 domain-containing protein YvlB